MVSVKVTTQRRITLPDEVLLHLDIKPGERITLDLVPNGYVRLNAARKSDACSDANLAALAIEAQASAERSMAAIDEALDRIAESNARIAAMEADGRTRAGK
jgi:bifunctional DNA-binding transcriptional regulator/antitoxin component of YhaV-PrlF toxin-antitoxin module